MARPRITLIPRCSISVAATVSPSPRCRASLRRERGPRTLTAAPVGHAGEPASEFGAAATTLTIIPTRAPERDQQHADEGPPVDSAIVPSAITRHVITTCTTIMFRFGLTGAPFFTSSPPIHACT